MAEAATSTSESVGSRERLLAAAAELVATRGYAGTSVEAIASRAGVVKSALYWHFRNKEELIATALEVEATGWIEAIERSISRASTPEERLDLFLEHSRRTILAQSPPVRLLYSLLIERGEQDPILRSSVARIFERLRAGFERDFRDRVGLPAERAEGIALVLVSALHGSLFDQLADPHEARFDRWLESLRQMVAATLAHELARSRGAEQ
jgi:AcrR family transcriptional regulator